MPELTAALTDFHQQNLIFAVGLLGRIGRARVVVPSLEKLLGTGFDDAAVAQALWAIDRQTNTALRYLTNAIEDRSGNAAYTLGTMGLAGVRPALPFLLAALDSQTGNVRMNSARAVARIAVGPCPAPWTRWRRLLVAGFEARPSDMDAHGFGLVRPRACSGSSARTPRRPARLSNAERGLRRRISPANGLPGSGRARRPGRARTRTRTRTRPRTRRRTRGARDRARVSGGGKGNSVVRTRSNQRRTDDQGSLPQRVGGARGGRVEPAGPR